MHSHGIGRKGFQFQDSDRLRQKDPPYHRGKHSTRTGQANGWTFPGMSGFGREGRRGRETQHQSHHTVLASHQLRFWSKVYQLLSSISPSFSFLFPHSCEARLKFVYHAIFANSCQVRITGNLAPLLGARKAPLLPDNWCLIW